MSSIAALAARFLLTYLGLGGAFLWARPPPNSAIEWLGDHSVEGAPLRHWAGRSFFCFMTVSRETLHLIGWCYSPIGAGVFPVVQHRLAGED
jgi:hypothetical protein